MKLVIDSLESVTDWVVNAPSTIEEITEKSMIAGLNESSLMIKFDSADTTRTAVKTFGTPYDVTDYESLVFSIWSQQYETSGNQYLKAEDFAYKIKINSTKEFYIPLWQTFSDITIGIEEITEIDRIEITPLHAITDYIIISEMVAEKEQLPFDILFAVKEHLEHLLTDSVGDGISIGTVSTTAGDSTMSLEYPDYLNKYAVIKIDDGSNSETHQIMENDTETWRFNSNYDGETIVNDFTDATVYLIFPVYINPVQSEIKLPGLAVWGIEPNPILRGAKLDTQYDTYSVDQDNFKGRTEGEILEYPVLVDVESRNYDLIDIMARAVRKLVGGEVLWINGRHHDISYTGSPTEMRPTEGIDIIPKVQYSLTVEVKENINDRVTLPKTTTINLDITGGLYG